jgi:hypothetical protein
MSKPKGNRSANRAKEFARGVLWKDVGVWFLVWTIAAPLTLIAGVTSVVLVVFARTRPIGRIVSGGATIAGTALTLLFAKAYDVACHSESHAYDLITPEERATTALFNGGVSLTGLTVGMTAAALAFRLSRRRSLPPA